MGVNVKLQVRQTSEIQLRDELSQPTQKGDAKQNQIFKPRKQLTGGVKENGRTRAGVERNLRKLVHPFLCPVVICSSIFHSAVTAVLCFVSWLFFNRISFLLFIPFAAYRLSHSSVACSAHLFVLCRNISRNRATTRNSKINNQAGSILFSPFIFFSAA